MKKLIGNIVWLVPFCLMVAVPTYPQVAGIAQALAWVYISLAIIAVPCVLVAVCIVKKEDLESFAKKKGWLSKAFGWIKSISMFAAIAFAGFTVAAGIYLLLSLVSRLVQPLAEHRLKDLS